jgi:hypothetical protein
LGRANAPSQGIRDNRTTRHFIPVFPIIEDRENLPATPLSPEFFNKRPYLSTSPNGMGIDQGQKLILVLRPDQLPPPFKSPL